MLVEIKVTFCWIYWHKHQKCQSAPKARGVKNLRLFFFLFNGQQSLNHLQGQSKKCHIWDLVISPPGSCSTTQFATKDIFSAQALRRQTGWGWWRVSVPAK